MVGFVEFRTYFEGHAIAYQMVERAVLLIAFLDGTMRSTKKGILQVQYEVNVHCRMYHKHMSYILNNSFQAS